MKGFVVVQVCWERQEMVQFRLSFGVRCLNPVDEEVLTFTKDYLGVDVRQFG